LKNDLTARQEFVLVRLYEDFGWAAVPIAKAVGLGRRLIENALRRNNVQLRRRSNKVKHVYLTAEAAKQWFDAAGEEDRAALENPTPQRMNETYRRCRCQHCLRLNEYATNCAGCGAPL
jgi:N-acetylglutamate synthase-like GNAT family acetyltransferase